MLWGHLRHKRSSTEGSVDNASRTIKLTLRPADWHLYALRGFFIAAATLLFFPAIATMPIADALAIFFVEPFILTLLSAWLLGEKVGWRRISASFAGFVGALIIIKPGSAVFSWLSVLPLAAAFCFAGYLILTRQLAQREHPVPVQFYTAAFGFIAMTAALTIGTLTHTGFLTASLPNLQQLGLMALLGAVGTVGHLLVVLAFRYLDASVLAPFQYLEIVSAVILGWWLFTDIPSPSNWIGIAIIVSSGLYVYVREQQLKQRSSTSQTA